RPAQPRECRRDREIEESEIVAGAAWPFERARPLQHVVGPIRAARQREPRIALIENTERRIAEALLDRRLGLCRRVDIDAEIGAADRRDRNAQIADRLAGALLLGDRLAHLADVGV